MKPFSLAILLLILLGSSSCNKEEYAFHKEVDHQFIRALIDGQEVVVSAAVENGYDNWYLFDATAERGQGVDQLNMIRYARDGSAEIRIYASGYQLLNRSFPTSLQTDRSHPAGCRILSMQYVQHRTGGQESTLDGELELTIQSWSEDGMMEGTFSGILVDGQEAIRVEKGRFRSRVFSDHR